MDPSDKIGDVKKKISSIAKQSPDNVKLLSSQQAALEEDKSLADYKVDTNDVFYWVQRKEGTHSSGVRTFFYLTLAQAEVIGRRSICRSSPP